MRVLVVDDEKNLRESLVELIESEGFTVDSASDGADALLKIRETDFACIFLDIKMPRMDGLELLAKLREENLTASPVIIISAFGDSDKTIEAMRLGAYDYITKPIDVEEILNTLRRAVMQFKQSAESVSDFRKKLPVGQNDTHKNRIIGTSPAMRNVFKQIGRVSATDATVLITGASGTGKELVARAIHEHSARSEKPFIAVNCGALPESLIEAELFGYERGAFTGAVNQKKGRFEIAGGGTLFLDEIGELPPLAQVKLLRALQERKFERVGGTETITVDVRIIAATNRNLQSEIEAKNFREDLFYRLNVISIHLPTLSERLSDVPQLAEFFVERSLEKHNLSNKVLSGAALRELMNRNFTGHVRELENIIERAVVTSGVSRTILPEHLFQVPPEKTETSIKIEDLLNLSYKEAVSRLEKLLIEKALREAQGNRSEAARKLEINRRLLYDKIEEHHIE